MLVPYSVNGRIRLANVAASAGDRDRAFIGEEEARKIVVQRCRAYFEGTQYDADNLLVAQTLGIDPTNMRMPEHHRLHAYSTHIPESVQFIADQLTSGFTVEAEDTGVGTVLAGAWEATDTLTGGDSDGELVVEPLVCEALTVGDLPYEVRWDPFEATCWLEFWDSEQVQYIVPKGTRPERVIRTEVVWALKEGVDVQVTERVEYEVLRNGEHGNAECRRALFWDEDEAPREIEWLGIPVLPWGLLRGHRKGLRQFRGEPLVTTRAMDNADRYDANEQLSYLIARYNSHGNLVVVGDAAEIQLKTEGRVEKDVADVLTFPGGTNAFSLTLPTDAQMIEHQRKVLADALYSCFGLTRVEPDTLGGLGGVSGYALEILNRKTEGTFRRVRRQWKKDWKTLCNLILDVTAYKQAELVPAVAPDAEPGLDTQDMTVPEGWPVPAFWEVNPLEVFPARGLKINMGSGYIVDDVAVRDDFTAKMISRKRALMERGYSPDEVEEIEGEIGEEAPAETSTFGSTFMGVAPVEPDSRLSTGRA